ncbi:Peptidase family S41 [Chitinophaga eiseniae]|uniref:Peptidase family S41 n=1 Tax=Chitinophaga eiseniae TaxID=634771 RepID=A0A1T4TGN1_9BACT|nr:S41 family peptidase [Chitinophaga eiseniae]SKA39635.1 Peptidase family S41 [Chitinophaga eiseniae]
MRRYIVVVLFFFFLPQFSNAQTFKNDSVKLFLDRSIALIKSNSINAGNIALIKNVLYEKSQNLTSIDEVAPLFEDVFKGLDDYHGSLKYKGKTYGWTKKSSYVNPYLKAKLKTATNVSSRLINGNYGYIRIPGNNDFGFKKVDSIANDIVSNINAIDGENIKGWIIDLRVNTGGNMYPILLALKEFIGNDVVFGGFRNAQNEPSGNWEIKDHHLLIDGTRLERKSGLAYPDKARIPVVMLISGYTASAGEMTAISFIGRPNLYLVGEPTANYTTAVQGFEIGKSAAINLSTDYVIDRNHKVYKTSIVPDFEILNGDNFENVHEDAKIRKALQLFKKSKNWVY